jgi:putative endonuclease
VTARADLGAFGERIAAQRLAAEGLTVLGKNIRTASGEIDIIACEGSDHVFVEVRTRRALPGAAAESISPVKLRRMWRCAMQHCEAAGIDPETARIDIISIDLDPDGRVSTIEHFRGLEVPEGGE